MPTHRDNPIKRPVDDLAEWVVEFTDDVVEEGIERVLDLLSQLMIQSERISKDPNSPDPIWWYGARDELNDLYIELDDDAKEVMPGMMEILGSIARPVTEEERLEGQIKKQAWIDEQWSDIEAAAEPYGFDLTDEYLLRQLIGLYKDVRGNKEDSLDLWDRAMNIHYLIKVEGMSMADAWSEVMDSDDDELPSTDWRASGSLKDDDEDEDDDEYEEDDDE